MCRFVVYKGPRLLMADLISRPDHSLIHQSIDAHELRQTTTNGDGFGIGWYAPEIDSVPCLYTSIAPAWNNRNLHRLAGKITSSCIFAHVRAASPGLIVTEVNCHPFQHGPFLWMHNGVIAEFKKIKRRLRASLRDDVYHGIMGTTDSEHAFALFLNQLKNPHRYYTPDVLRRAMVTTIQLLDDWSREAGIQAASFYNFAVTDGQTVVATRYVNRPRTTPPSLYFSHGAKFEWKKGALHMTPARKNEYTFLVSSEPLTKEKKEWEPVPRNHLLLFTPEMEVQMDPIR